MLFCSLIFFHLIRVVFNVTGESSSSENTLDNAVNTFYVNFTFKNLNSEFKPNYNFNRGTNILATEFNNLMIQRSVQNLEYVFQELKDNRMGELLQERRHSDQHFVHISKAEHMICSYTTRYLDFIYVNTNIIEPVLKLQQWYSIMCDSWPNMVYGQCTVQAPQPHTRICSRYVVNALNELINEPLYEYKYIRGKKKNVINHDSVTYIFEMYRAINGMDVLNIIEERFRYDYNIFFRDIRNAGVISIDALSSNVPVNYLPDNPTAPINWGSSNEPNQKLKRNTEYINNMKTRCTNYLTGMDNIESNDIVITTYLLLVKTYIRFQTIIQYQLNLDYEKLLLINEEYVYKTNFEVPIVKFHKEVCEYAPLLIFHFQSGNRTNTELISIYMVLCSGDMDFIISRCISDNGESYNVKCIIYSLKQRMLVNTNYIPSMHDLRGHKIYAADQNYCVTQMFTFITKTYESVKNYHKIYHNNVPVWFTFKWVSGQNMLTMNSESIIMQEFKYNKIRFVGPSSIPLIAVYKQILPWSFSCIDTIMIFHYHILHNLDRTMNIFLYRQVKLISMYFQSTNDSLTVEIFNLMKTSYVWFIGITAFFHQILMLSGKFKPNNSALYIIDRIKNKFDEDLLTDILNTIPEQELTNILEWVTSTDESNPQVLAYRNCTSGLLFMDELIRIAKESMLMIDHIKPNYEETYSVYCSNEIFNFISSYPDDNIPGIP